MGFLTRLFINALALGLTVLLGRQLGLDMYFAGGTVAAKAASAIVMVIVLAIVNATIRPLVALITAPLNCLTLGLLTFVINAVMFLLAAVIVNNLGFGIHVGGFLGGLFGSIVMGIISAVATSLVADPDRRKVD